MYSVQWGFQFLLISLFNSIYQIAWQQQNNINYDSAVNKSNSKNNNIFPFDIIRPGLLTVITFLIVLCFHVINSSVLWNILNSVGHSLKQKIFLKRMAGAALYAYVMLKIIILVCISVLLP
jgi:hypothetical protein